MGHGHPRVGVPAGRVWRVHRDHEVVPGHRHRTPAGRAGPPGAARGPVASLPARYAAAVAESDAGRMGSDPALRIAGDAGGLGQHELCSVGLFGFSNLPRRLVAAHGVRARVYRAARAGHGCGR